MFSLFPSWYLLVLMVVLLMAEACESEKSPDIIIHNINIIDVEEGDVIKHQDVFILENRIIRIQDHEKPVVKARQVIDGNGKYLIPGLWDMHSHIRSYSHEDVLPLFILHGVVGIRDLGLTDFKLIKSWKEQIQKEEIIGPRIYSSGCIIEGSNPHFRNSLKVTKIERVKPVIDSLVNQGVDLIKLYDTLDKEIYEAIVRYCQQNEILTAGHVPSSLNQISASEIGLKSIEHLSGLDNTLHKYYTNEDFETFIKTFQVNETYHCPTLVNYSFVASLDRSQKERQLILDQIDEEQRFDLAPKYYRAWWSRIKDNYAKAKKYKNKADELLFYNDIVKNLNDNGIKILAGTDAPNPYLIPGLSLHEELAMLVESGLTTLDALRAATLYPAEYFSITDYSGSVSENSIADLLILDANPLEDITNTQRINAVILDGKLFSKDSLSSMRASHLERISQYNAKDFDQYIYMKLQKEGVSTIIKNYPFPKSNEAYTIEAHHLVRLGKVFWEADQIEDAIKLLKWNIEIFPEYLENYQELGHLYLDDGDTLNAINNFEIINRINPLDSINLAKLKNLNAAIRSF
jgi:imidazolonepropionase-like amidohydrolase